MSAESKLKLNFQTVLYILLAGALAYFVYNYRGQLVDIVDVLQEGLWYFVLATVLVLGVTIYNQAMLYTSIYRLFELPSYHYEMVPLYLVRRFVSVAAPSGGFSGWVPFIQFARKHDIGIGAVFAANLIYTILWYSTFFVFMFFGLLTLFFAHDLKWFEISAALVMLVTDLIMITGLVLAWVAPRTLVKVVSWISTAFEKVFSWIRRDPPLKRHQFMRFASDLNSAIDQMREAGWPRLMIPVVHALLNESLHILMLFLSALAFGVQLNFGVLVAAYSISVLFYVVSPTPGGLGFVEGTLIVVLTTLGVQAHNATVITLAYRGISFWLPFFLGFVALRWFNQHTEAGQEPEEELKAEREYSVPLPSSTDDT